MICTPNAKQSGVHYFDFSSDNRVIMKGIDTSYYYEGYTTYKASEL